MKMNKKDKIFGFWFSAATAVWMLVTAIVYALSFGPDPTFILMIAGAVLGAGLLAADKMRIFPVFAFILSFAAAILYGIKMASYVFEFFVGIEVTSLSVQFIACTVLLLIALVAGIFSLLIEQEK